MYESIIRVEYSEPIYEKIQDAIEGEVYTAVLRVGISVNREELIRALEYDRNQYENGYADGYADGLEKAMEDGTNES